MNRQRRSRGTIPGTIRAGRASVHRLALVWKAVILYALSHSYIFLHLPTQMLSESRSDPVQDKARPIIEWLTTAHDHAAESDVELLREHLKTLRTAGVEPARQLQLLDFLFDHAQRVVEVFLPTLHALSLPVGRKARLRIRAVQSLLEALAQDYLDALTHLLHSPNLPQRAAGTALWRSVHCLSTHLLISDLTAAPAEVGLWQMLHRACRMAREHDLAAHSVPRHPLTLEQVYLSAILLAGSQPATFSSVELAFIVEYIQQGIDAVALMDAPPDARTGTYWIDPERDAPAQPLQRRPPPGETTNLWYFACDEIARSAATHFDALKKGYRAHQLGLPAFADTPAGRNILSRLAERWGNPPRRRFPRRRHTYRATLCAGINTVWRLLRDPDAELTTGSEWMVTNESPDGCAMMHVAGKTVSLRVGDLVAMRAEVGRGEPPAPWTICLVRWGLSENPEHIELGLQILAPTAEPAIVALPGDDATSARIAAILLPPIPPIRPQEALVVQCGSFPGHLERVTLVLDDAHVKVREFRPAGVCEQTGSIEIFNLVADEKN